MNLSLANFRIGERPDATVTPHSAEAAGPRGLDRLVWTMIASSACAVMMAVILGRFTFIWSTLLLPAAFGGALLALAWLYRRRDVRIAAALTGTAQLIAFSSVAAPLSYIAASLGWPLQDALFDAADRALGLDWMALLAWMNGHPTLYAVLRPIYLCLTPQITVAVLCLAFTGRLAWLRVYVLAFIFAALVTIAISAVLPAEGVWPYYGLTPVQSPHVMPVVSTSWPAFHGLRDGSFRALLALGSEGIITFPSLHAALAVILIAALWPVPVVRWVILVLNGAMLAATPIDGSHYFIDVIAGIVIAVLCLFAAQWIAAHGLRPRRTVAEAKLPGLVPGN